MKKVIALFAFFALSSAYAADENRQVAQDPSTTEQTQTQDQGVIKKKKATDEEEAAKKKEQEKAGQATDQSQQHNN